MEIYELRYFLAVAKAEHIHRASEEVNVSPGSLSKAISRLESELSVSLFSRQGRNIKLTPQGKLLQKRASKIIHLEESTRFEVGSHQSGLQINVSGTEALLTHFGLSFMSDVKKKFPNIVQLFSHDFDQEVFKKINNGESHIGFVTTRPPDGLYKKKLGEVLFQTAVSKKHSLFKLAKKNAEISIDQLLEHPFVSPDNPILGKVATNQSLDGWRDDKFKRKIEWSTSSLSTLSQIINLGQGVGYVPDYLLETHNWAALNVTGCPYSCKQSIYLIARDLDEISWLRKILN